MDRSRIDAHSQTGVEGGEMGPEPAQAKRGITSCSSDATQLGRTPLMLKGDPTAAGGPFRVLPFFGGPIPVFCGFSAEKRGFYVGPGAQVLDSPYPVSVAAIAANQWKAS